MPVKILGVDVERSGYWNSEKTQHLTIFANGVKLIANG